jgi:hypothetical protein
MRLKLETEFDRLGFERIFKEDLLTDEVNKLIRILRSVMEADKVYASYALVQSIEPENVSESEINLKMNYYFTFVNEGVRGIKGGKSYAGYAYKDKKPPYSAFIEWDRFKVIGINPYAMAYHIYYQGIKPRQFVEKAIEKYKNQ